MVAEPVILELWYWVVMVSAQEVEMLRRQLDELTAQMIEVRQQSSSTAMNAAVSGLAEAVRTMTQSVSKPRPEDMRVGKPEPYVPGKDDWDFTFNGYAGTLDPAHPALLKAARQSPRVWWRLHHTNSSLQPCCTCLRCSHRKEHGKSWGKLETTVSKLTDNCTWCTEHPIRKAARDCSCKSWRTSSVPRSKTWKTVWTNFWNWWDDTTRRTVLILFPTKWKRHASFRTRLSLWRLVFSWTGLCWETSTHYAWRLRITWGADTSSRRPQPETHTTKIRWKSMPSPGKGKAKSNPARARRVLVKEKKPLRQRLRGNDNRALALRGWVSKLRKVRTQNCWLLVQAAAQTSRQRKGLREVEIQSDRNQRKRRQYTSRRNLGTKHVCTATRFVSCKHDWMRRWRTLDILAGRQQEPSAHSELGRSVRLQDWGARVDDRLWMFWTCLSTMVCTSIPNGEFYKRLW